MTTSRRTLVKAAALSLMAKPVLAATGQDAPASAVASASPLLVDAERGPDFKITLWPAGIPGGIPSGLREQLVARSNRFNLPDHAVHEVTNPRLEVFRPRAPNGRAILMVPGGGYRWVVLDKEGYEGARYFSRQGFMVYVLIHRLPHQGWAGRADTPLQDAQRALRLIRSRADQDGINPNQLLALGFSAGGHVAGSLATRFDALVYPIQDAVDEMSARPDKAALIYPVATMRASHSHGDTRRNLIGTAPTSADVARYSLEHDPPAKTPPCFLLHAADDVSVPVENSLWLFESLRRAGVATALHVFADGGHGFGLRGIDDTPLARWPQMLLEWA